MDLPLKDSSLPRMCNNQTEISPPRPPVVLARNSHPEMISWYEPDDAGLAPVGIDLVMLGLGSRAQKRELMSVIEISNLY